MTGSRFDRDSIKAIPLLVGAFLLLKAYVVADYSLTTAGVLVSEAPLTVLVGTLTAYINIAVLLIFIGTLTVLVRNGRAALTYEKTDRSPDSAPDHEVDAITFGIFLVCFVFLPVPSSIRHFKEEVRDELTYIAVAGLTILAAWQIIKFLARRPGLRVMRHALPRRSWFMATFVVVLLLPTLKSSWVPAEVLILRQDIAIQDSHRVNGRLETSKYPVVYILSENSRWTTALDAESRILLRIPTEAILHRQVCRAEGQPPGTVPLGAFLLGYDYKPKNSKCKNLLEHRGRRLDPLIFKPDEAN